MLLSKENQAKLCLSGLYRHQPEQRYRGKLYADNLYWCCNWTFNVYHDKNKFWMQDTYWSNSDGLSIVLTDENISEFELIFDFNDVEEYRGRHVTDYYKGDIWHVAIDSGGMTCGGKYYIRKGAEPNKEYVLARVKDEVEYTKRELERKQDLYNRILSGELRELKYI